MDNHSIPNVVRKVQDPHSFSYCPFCGENLRKETFPVEQYKINRSVICDECDIELI